MGISEPRTTLIYYILVLACAAKPTGTIVTVTTYDGTGIVQQQPLTLRCNYTKDGSDAIIGFDWNHGTDVIVSGSVTNQTARFQIGTLWESGVFLGDYTSSLTIQLSAFNVTPSVAGKYTCRVSTRESIVKGTATATVNYSPKIESTFPTSKTVAEFSSLQLDCNSDTTLGNPQTTSYTWTYDGSIIRSGAVLDLKNITRDKSGQYTCTATNTVGSDSETAIVEVQYAPHIESTFPSSKTVAEFSSLQINCSTYLTPGNPKATSYTWTYGGSTISSEAIVYIKNIVRDRRGQYTCTASNSVGSDSETVSVDVQYLDRPKLLVNKTEVVENETVSLTCNVTSNPTAELEIRNVDNKTNLATRDTNRLQFTIDRVQCLHNGSILCTARNTQTGNVSYSAFKEIDVKCSPRQDFRQKLDSTVVKHINETAVLVADVIANPVPNFRWFKQESEGLTNISRDTAHSISNSHLQSVLYINISRTQDYGDYVLEMENSQGRKQLLFTLTKGSEKSMDEEGNILPIVVGIISAVVVVAACIVGVFLCRRKQKGLDCFKRKSEVPEKMEMTENEAYASSAANAGAIYAIPNKQKNANTKANADAVYAEANKQKKANTKNVVYENAKRGQDNGGLQADKNVKKQVPKVGLDEDGLTYVQIDTTNKKPAKNAKPRTTPRPTAYATISYGQVGDPLPDEEEKD